MSEARIVDELYINAPLAKVWRAIEDPDAHARWHPFVTEISGLHQLGQVRTCSVAVGKKPGQTTERCVEQENGRRMVWAIENDTTGFGGMVEGWRAGFTVASRDEGTVVTAESTFRPRNPLIRATLPIIRRKFHQTQQAILRGLQESLEGVATSPRPSRRST
jgi:uncharacterized protein YndB with AHSA1/START domain